MYKLILNHTKYLKEKFSNFNTRLIVGITLTCIIVILGILAPFITWYPPLTVMQGPPYQPPSLQYLFGTDDLGRDIYVNTIYGIRTSLIVGVLSALIATLIGILLGIIAGYYRGFLEDLLMRITDMAFIIPQFLLALIIVTTLGPNIYNIILAIGVTSWPGIARMTRATTLSVKQQTFIEAAKVLGLSDIKIISSELLPNSLPSVIPYITLQIGNNILVEAGLGFLGVSDPNVSSLGMLLNNAQQHILANAWWMSVFPGIFLSLMILGFNLLGDGLIEYMNPRLRRKAF
jgi:peptide/nickel transport system permease protein